MGKEESHQILREMPSPTPWGRFADNFIAKINSAKTIPSSFNALFIHLSHILVSNLNLRLV